MIQLRIAEDHLRLVCTEERGNSTLRKGSKVWNNPVRAFRHWPGWLKVFSQFIEGKCREG